MAIRPEFDRENNRCFGCGPNNPIGLRLKCRKEDGKVKAEFHPRPEHQGWSGILHGGIICALLDEVMGYVAFFEGIHALTARMELRFRRPAEIGRKLFLTAEMLGRKKNLIEARASISFEDGTVIAEAKAVMFEA